MIRLVACEVFKPALDYLGLQKKYPRIHITFLPSRLHINPNELEQRLSTTIQPFKQQTSRIICCYGNCFGGMDDFCALHGLRRTHGDHCYEILLGPGRFKEIIEKTTGTYFVEQDLVRHFKEYCIDPLELYDEDMRHMCFAHYKKLLYLRQPADGDLLPEVKKIAAFLELDLDIKDADYSYLEKKLIDFVKGSLKNNFTF